MRALLSNELGRVYAASVEWSREARWHKRRLEDLRSVERRRRKWRIAMFAAHTRDHALLRARCAALADRQAQEREHQQHTERPDRKDDRRPKPTTILLERPQASEEEREGSRDQRRCTRHDPGGL